MWVLSSLACFIITASEHVGDDWVRIAKPDELAGKVVRLRNGMNGHRAWVRVDPAQADDGIINSETLHAVNRDQVFNLQGCQRVKVQLWGAAGGKSANRGLRGGYGGYTEATLTLPAGLQQLVVIIGERGRSFEPHNAYGGGGRCGADGGNRVATAAGGQRFASTRTGQT